MLVLSIILSMIIAVSKAQPQPLNYTSWVNKTVMMVSAHPDDIEATSGGLIALLTAQGTKVVYVIFTNGDKGCQPGSIYDCSNITSEQIAFIRHQEALNAASVLGVSDVILMDYEDGMLTSYPEAQLREELTVYIRQHQPSVVMSWFPYPLFQLQPSLGWVDLGFHPDHQQCGKLTLDVARGPSAGCRLMFPAAGSPWSNITEFFMWNLATPSHYVDITTSFQLKVDAFAQHKSQYPSATPAGAVLVQEMLENIGSMVAKNAQADVTLAEGFLAFN